MLDPAREDAERSDLGTRACCLVEPSRYRYFPAVISLDKEQPSRTTGHALVTMALRDSEAAAFFAAGQRFTIWADAVVGHTIQTHGLIGYGIISQPVSPPRRRAPRDEAPARSACPASAPTPGSSGHADPPMIVVSADCVAQRLGGVGRTAG
jgi:hypothetical protein